METLTENGAPTYKNFSDTLVNAWFKLSRNSSESEVEELITKAHQENKLHTWKMICAFRNFRDIGKGERELFVNCLKVMSSLDPDNLIANMNVLMRQGRLDDFYKLGNYFLEKVLNKTISDNEKRVFEEIVMIYTGCFRKDKMDMEKNQNISLLAKWADHQKRGIGMSILITFYLGLLEFSEKSLRKMDIRINGFDDLLEFIFNRMKFPLNKTDVRLEKIIEYNFKENEIKLEEYHWKVIKSFNFGLSRFRKEYLSPLNKYLRTLEIEMCEKTFELSEENIEKLPALAVKKYQKYFSRNFPDVFLEISKKVISGQLKLKGITIDLANFGKEYFDGKDLNPITEGQFESLLEHLFSHMITSIEQDNEFVISCPVSDISGSMLTKIGGVVPLYVCGLMSIIMVKMNILAKYKEMSVSTRDKLGSLSARTLVEIVMGKREIPDGIDIPFYAKRGISFSETPQYYEIPFASLSDCVKAFKNQPVGFSTNFFSVFNLIKQMKIAGTQNIPHRVIALTDGQFDMQTHQPLMTTVEAIKDLFEGTPPELVYWNIGVSSQHKTTDISESEEGFSALSGYNPNLTQVILFNEGKKDKEKMTAIDILDRILNHDAFKEVKIV